MAKVIYASLDKTAGAEGKAASKKPVRTKTVRLSDGSKVKMVSLDADSPSFTQDLTSTFKRNVARARRENLRLLGKADGGA